MKMCFYHTPPVSSSQLYDRVTDGIQVMNVARISGLCNFDHLVHAAFMLNSITNG